MLIKNVKDVPQGSHYTVLVYTTASVYIEGDERSRTNPGHGYPARTESYDTFAHHVFDSRKDLTDFVTKLLREKPNRKDFVVLEVKKQLEPTVQVELN